VNKFKTSASASHDNLKPKLIKRVCEEISLPLTNIINLIFEHSTVPDELKFGNITPIFKAGNVMKFQNYRLISVLPVFSKILERLIHDRI
ncbi:hypothetical protein CAPTEDRAFT_81113, partial [Capitella teleta]